MDHKFNLKTDRDFFEFLTLGGAQAGLNWKMILNKRDDYKKEFMDYDYEKVASFTDAQYNKIMTDSNLIKNGKKIGSVIANAQALIHLLKEYNSFENYLSQFIDQYEKEKKIGHIIKEQEVLAMATSLGKDLKKRNFKFVGQKLMETLILAYKQTTGQKFEWHGQNKMR